MVELTTIIFTKDRPAQLDLLLRSMARFHLPLRAENVHVLARATDPDALRGYGLVQEDRRAFTWHWEQDFKADAVALTESAQPLVQFVMDDDLYIRPFHVHCPRVQQLAQDDSLQSVVLRMAPYMDICQTENLITPPPAFDAQGRWYWPGLPGDWGYPHSVDGTIFRRDDILPAVRDGNYRSPTRFEPSLRSCMTRPLCRCFDEPIILNIPNNSVQDDAPENRNAGDDPAAMTQRFLDGERIALEPLLGLRMPAPHWEIPYSWEAKGAGG